MLSRIWDCMADESYRSRLVLVGGALAALATGSWQLYLHLAPASAVVVEAPASSAATTIDREPRGRGVDVDIRTGAKSGGNFIGDASVKDLDIICAKTATISSVVTAGGDVAGSVGVDGVKISGDQDRNCSVRIEAKAVAGQ